jgi:hypothetical protein
VLLWWGGSENNTIKGNFNLEIDLRDNKDNANIYFDANIENKQVIKFELDNKATIEYKEVEIIEPQNDNIVPSTEIFSTNGIYNY